MMEILHLYGFHIASNRYFFMGLLIYELLSFDMNGLVYMCIMQLLGHSYSAFGHLLVGIVTFARSDICANDICAK